MTPTTLVMLESLCGKLLIGGIVPQDGEAGDKQGISVDRAGINAEVRITHTYDRCYE